MTRFLFVTGAGRCGTTVLRGLLDGHSRLAVLPGETTDFLGNFLEESGRSERLPADLAVRRLLGHFTGLYPDGEAEAEAAGRIRGALAALGDSHPGGVTAHELLTALVAALHPEPRPWTVVDVTDPNVAGLLSAFPDSRVVHMIRHPMDQLNSEYRFRFRDANSFGGAYPGTWEFGKAFFRVHRAFREAGRFGNDPRVAVVRLEDLQEDPAKAVSAVLGLMDLEPEPVNGEITRGSTVFDAGSTQKKTTRLFVSERDWSCLTPNDLHWCSRMAGARDWYDVPDFPEAPNGFKAFLWRQLGFTGRNRVRPRSPVRFLKVVLVAFAQFLNDQGAKHYFESHLAGDGPL